MSSVLEIPNLIRMLGVIGLLIAIFIASIILVAIVMSVIEVVFLNKGRKEDE